MTTQTDVLTALNAIQDVDAEAEALMRELLLITHNSSRAISFNQRVRTLLIDDASAMDMVSSMSNTDYASGESAQATFYASMIPEGPSEKDATVKRNQMLHYSKQQLALKKRVKEDIKTKRAMLARTVDNAEEYPSILGRHALFPSVKDVSSILGNEVFFPTVTVESANPSGIKSHSRLSNVTMSNVGMSSNSFVQGVNVFCYEKTKSKKTIGGLADFSKELVSIGPHTRLKLKDFGVYAHNLNNFKEQVALKVKATEVKSVDYTNILITGNDRNVELNFVFNDLKIELEVMQGKVKIDLIIKVVLSFTIVKSSDGFHGRPITVDDVFADNMSIAKRSFAITTVPSLKGAPPSIHTTGYNRNPSVSLSSIPEGELYDNLTFMPLITNDMNLDTIISSMFSNTDPRAHFRLDVRSKVLRDMKDEKLQGVDMISRKLLNFHDNEDFNAPYFYHDDPKKSVLHMDIGYHMSFLLMDALKYRRPTSFNSLKEILEEALIAEICEYHNRDYETTKSSFLSHSVLERLFGDTITYSEQNKVHMNVTQQTLTSHPLLAEVPNIERHSLSDCLLRILLSIIFRAVSRPDTFVPVIHHSFQSMILLTTPICVSNKIHQIGTGRSNPKLGKPVDVNQTSITLYFVSAAVAKSLFEYVTLSGSDEVTFGSAAHELRGLIADAGIVSSRHMTFPAAALVTSIEMVNRININPDSLDQLRVFIEAYDCTFSLDAFIMDCCKALFSATKTRESKRLDQRDSRLFTFVSERFSLLFMLPDDLNDNEVRVFLQSSSRRSRIVKPLKNVHDSVIRYSDGVSSYVNEIANKSFYMMNYIEDYFVQTSLNLDGIN